MRTEFDTLSQPKLTIVQLALQFPFAQEISTLALAKGDSHTIRHHIGDGDLLVCVSGWGGPVLFIHHCLLQHWLAHPHCKCFLRVCIIRLEVVDVGIGHLAATVVVGTLGGRLWGQLGRLAVAFAALRLCFGAGGSSCGGERLPAPTTTPAVGARILLLLAAVRGSLFGSGRHFFGLWLLLGGRESASWLATRLGFGFAVKLQPRSAGLGWGRDVARHAWAGVLGGSAPPSFHRW